MKFTSRMLLTMLVILIAGLFFSNFILKNEFDKADKTDNYWNYEKLLNQPFKYLKITGGNGTRIAYEQSQKCSVRILQEWERWHGGKINARVSNDTLLINFDFVPTNLYEKFWMQNATTVRIFSPYLLSVDGYNTHFEMFKLKQRSIRVNMSGKSSFEIESLFPSLDSLTIHQSDSSEVVFEMSPDFKRRPTTEAKPVITIEDTVKGSVIHFTPGVTQIKSKEAMIIESVNAVVQGYSLLDLGHAQIKSLQLSIADSSAIILSGGALRKMRQ